MRTISLPLHFSPDLKTTLYQEYRGLNDILDKGRSLSEDQLVMLRNHLTYALGTQPALQWEVLQEMIQDTSVRPQHLHLTAGPNAPELLELPWHLVGQGHPNLIISKGLPLQEGAVLPVFNPDLALPLKVLVMIAAPENGQAARLHFEEEEKVILDALTLLVQSGQVELNFTEDGSLESLSRALEKNQYHVLHFSGHSTFESVDPDMPPETFLLLEDEFSMKSQSTPVTAFADLLLETGHPPALVLLSSCQSGQNGASGDFRGAAHQLMRAGIPAVIAMGWNVADFWATHFAGTFFQALAERNPLGSAFNLALAASRKNIKPGLPNEFFLSQSLIPQLFLTKQVTDIVHWEADEHKKLSRAGATLLQKNDRLAAKLHKVSQPLSGAASDLIFIGRRRELKVALSALRAGRSVMLIGQGGMGKTAMAQYLALRRLAADPNGCLPLAFDEKSLSLTNICDALLEHLEDDVQELQIRAETVLKTTQWGKFYFLLDAVKKHGTKPFFILDNLEAFQPANDPGGPLKPAVLELLDFMLNRLGFPVLCTGRYPLGEFDDDTLLKVNLNEVAPGDFRQKCLLLDGLKRLEFPERSFENITVVLYITIGGNYRALEFFDELCRNAPKLVPQTFDKFDHLLAYGKAAMIPFMSGNLIVENLISLLSLDERRALMVLSNFECPVLPLAVEWQHTEIQNTEPLLRHAARLTLVEQRNGEMEGKTYYYVSTLVREMLAAMGLIYPDFDHEQAGAYFEHMFEAHAGSAVNLIEAFSHYEKVRNIEKINRIGTMLGNGFYKNDLLYASYEYAQRAEEATGEQIAPELLCLLGILNQQSQDWDAALHYFKRALHHFLGEGNQKEEAILLNNIAKVYQDRHDYSQAIHYLDQSLAIQKEINDLEGAATSLMNLGQIYAATAHYEKATDYFNQSLQIKSNIGNSGGEGTILSELGLIYSKKGDQATAMSYYKKSLLKDGLVNKANTLQRMAYVCIEEKKTEEAIRYLEESLKIYHTLGNEIGIATVMSSLGLIQSRKGEKEAALRHFDSALIIYRTLRNTREEGIVLNNISEVYLNEGDYEMATYYLQEAGKLLATLDEPHTLAIQLSHIGFLYFKQEKLEEAVVPLFHSMRLLQSINSSEKDVPLAVLTEIVEVIGMERFQTIMNELN